MLAQQRSHLAGAQEFIIGGLLNACFQAAAGLLALLLLSRTQTGLAQDTGSSRAFKFLMGTQVRVETFGGTLQLRQAATDEAFAAVAEVDRIMSDYRDDSELMMVNRTAALRPVRVSDPLFAVLDAASRVFDASGGAFDASIRPLHVLTGLKNRQAHQPTPAELANIRPLVGFRQVALDRSSQTVKFARSGMALDLTGIAHGFASEFAAGSLRRRGLTGVVDTGTPYVVGAPPGKSASSVGIGKPGTPAQLLGAVDVKDAAVATVTATANGFPRFDPRTLQPVAAALSATVISPDGTLAEALANAVLALGPRDGLALLERFDRAWGLVVFRKSDRSLGIAVTQSQQRSFHPVR